MGSRDEQTRKILARIEEGRPVSQRALSRELGVALGLTNLLVRRVVKKGWVKVVSIRPNRVGYFITPAGIREKVRVTRLYFENTVRLYTETRERIRQRLDELSATWPNGGNPKQIVFYGAGEVAEIAYISLQATDLRLVGVVDERNTKLFFGLAVHRPETLRSTHLNGQPFDCLVVTSFRKAPAIRARLQELAFPEERVFWL